MVPQRIPTGQIGFIGARGYGVISPAQTDAGDTDLIDARKASDDAYEITYGDGKFVITEDAGFREGAIRYWVAGDAA